VYCFAISTIWLWISLFELKIVMFTPVLAAVAVDDVSPESVDTADDDEADDDAPHPARSPAAMTPDRQIAAACLIFLISCTSLPAFK
jgi:hypothetical protein